MAVVTVVVAVLVLLAGCGAVQPSAGAAPPTTAPPPTTEAAPTTLLFGQTFTFPGGPRVLVLRPEPLTASPGQGAPGTERVELRLELTAADEPVVPRSDLRVDLAAGGRPVAPVSDAQAPGLTSDPLPAGRSRILVLAFAAPAGATGWQASVTFRGGPAAVFQEDI